mmetsp:Transcript_14726/g.20494  ORF Transcript_14726/g.20494 Transcript_14726/m.20494 type:complete len:152 (-) Transcript_14726:182-637(-)
MKLALSFGLLATVSAFAPQAAFTRQSMALFDTHHVDTADAIKAAMEASEKFGKTSVEARLAWDTVEEMDAANSHVKDQGSTAAPAAVATTPAEAKDSAAIASESMTMAEALADAKRITEELGISSPEARVAWETVEEIGATEAHHKTTGSG